ncbi:hypothetical protein [Micromonospora sp. NPDC005710]|uniref:hypothetical protein n=1 Tax=Micromonospora sp. NPDC005710 TaxID=3157051 RepID=UPI0033EB5D7F
MSSGDDLEGALRAAERLLVQAEERHRHGQNLTTAILSIMVGTALSFIASLAFFGFGAGGVSTIVGFLTAITTVGVLIITLRALMRQRQRMNLDYTLRIATQLSSMVDEALVDVAEREEWSYLRIDATKLRLAVFPAHNPRIRKTND